MLIEKPSVTVITINDPVKKIEWCGKVCWNSRKNITTESAMNFVKKLVKAEHTSVLEHARLRVPKCIVNDLLEHCNDTPYGFFNRTVASESFYDINARDYVAIGGVATDFDLYTQSGDYMTVELHTDRAICAELCRHREFSFTQSSTRYIRYKDSVPVILPVPFKWASDPDSVLYKLWYEGCVKQSEAYYNMLKWGQSPEEARDVLPQSTQADLIMTGTYKQWEHLLALRLEKHAHPQMQYLMELLVSNPNFPSCIKYKGVNE